MEIPLSAVTMHPKGTPAPASSVKAQVFEERVDLSNDMTLCVSTGRPPLWERSPRRVISIVVKFPLPIPANGLLDLGLTSVTTPLTTPLLTST